MPVPASGPPGRVIKEQGTSFITLGRMIVQGRRGGSLSNQVRMPALVPKSTAKYSTRLWFFFPPYLAATPFLPAPWHAPLDLARARFKSCSFTPRFRWHGLN